MAQRARSLADLGFATACLAVLAMPLLRFGAVPWDAQAERRDPSPPPGSEDGVRNWHRWTTQVESYLGDRFGLRASLLATRVDILRGVLNNTASPRVQMGKQGWMFLTDHGSLDDVRGHPGLDHDGILRWRDFLQHRHDQLAAQHVRYYFVPAPNKQSIYPEMLRLAGSTESSLDRLMASFPGGKPSWIIDLRPGLHAAKSTGQLYFTHDGHWNEWGAYIGYSLAAHALLADGVALRALPLQHAAFTVMPRSSGDLASMTQASGLVESVPHYNGLPLPCGHQTVPPPVPGIVLSPIAEADLAIECPEAGNATRAVIINDSMLIASRAYWQTSFGHLRTFWTSVGPEGMQGIIDAEHPDVVIDARVERALVEDYSQRQAASVFLTQAPPPASPPGGWASLLGRTATYWRLDGWAYWHPDGGAARLRVATNLPVQDTMIDRVERADVSAAQNDSTMRGSGFRLRLLLDSKAALPDRPYLCLWSDDPDFGPRRISIAGEHSFDLCPR